MAFRRKDRDATRRVLEVLGNMPCTTMDSRLSMAKKVYTALKGAEDPQLALLTAIAVNDGFLEEEFLEAENNIYCI